MSTYIARLTAAIRSKGNPVCVGLDPRVDQLPPELIETHELQEPHPPGTAEAAAYEEFCLRVIDVIAPLVPCVKPQAAFFEEQGPAGCAALARVIRYARNAGLVVICDAKRGDIGTTAEAYARGFLAGRNPDSSPWGADALTVNAYLGRDTLIPFVEVAKERGAGLYVLVRTSNPGAREFQDVAADSRTVFTRVAEAVEQLALETCGRDPFGVVGAVVGATYPAELRALRDQMPHAHLLIPGYGAQGGKAADIAPAFGREGIGAVVNSSRGIIFAWGRKDFQDRFSPRQWEAAVEAATREMIADLAAHQPE